MREGQRLFLIDTAFPHIVDRKQGDIMKKLIVLLAALLLILPLSAAFDPQMSDYLFYNQADYEADRAYLEKALEEDDGTDRAAILWRLSRTVLTITDGVSHDDKDGRLAGYGESERLADESLAIEETANGYHWKASAIGRIGQVNGPLNSLSKAKPMRALCEKVQNDFNADMSDCWYVLGLLYNQLPGSPLSFGNKNYAISYMRRCLDTQDNVNRLNLTNYLELAEQLADRNWNAEKRAKEFDKMKGKYDENTVPTEKMKFYEGQNGRNGQPFYSTLPLGQFSDAQEAVMLCQYALAVYGLKAEPLSSDTAKAEEIQAFLDGILR